MRCQGHVAYDTSRLYFSVSVAAETRLGNNSRISEATESYPVLMVTGRENCHYWPVHLPY